MEVRNRMADISKLRCNICQDYLRMVAQPNWQKQLYDKAKHEIEAGTKFKDKYIAAYERMRDIGIEQYSIEDMDVTLIVEVLYALKDSFPAEKNIINSINRLKTDRNAKGHSSENESPEELYLQGLLDLVNLRKFVVDVDKYELTIPDESRLAFRRKYISVIDELKETLDDERIETLQVAKQIDRDINRILQSEDPASTWIQVWELYMSRDWKIEKNPQGFNDFIVKASDAGIPQAHLGALDYFLIIQKDYAEAERRMFMLLASNEKLPKGEVKALFDAINTYIMQGNPLTPGMSTIVQKLGEQGYEIVASQEGLYSFAK